MNTKKTWKRFFSLNRHHAEGFTLVELIVVIAILAILGGVAVPAYSGYVEKAEYAADEALLAELNTAFAAACAISGESHVGRNDASAQIGEDKKAVVTTGITGFADTFGTFYEGGEFQKMTYLGYNSVTGMFSEGMPIKIGNYEITIPKSLADALQDNNFSTIGANKLLGKVDTVADIAAALLGSDPQNPNSIIDHLIYGEDGGTTYLKNLASTLNMNEEQLGAFLYDADGNIKKDILANSLVLTAAQKTQNMDTSFLGQAGSTDKLKAELDNPATATDAMAKLALTYGMYTSYVKATGQTDASEAILNSGSLTGMAEILRSVESKDFQDYLASPQGQADMDAYMASMQIVNNSANQSADATKDILTNGFTDPDLVGVLDGLMNPAAE